MNDDKTKLTFSKNGKASNANAGDVPEWVYDAVTMALLQKKDAAGKGASYTYHPNGTLATR